jgi:predicted ferric reductase
LVKLTQGKTDRYVAQGAFWVGVYLLLTLAPVLLLLVGPTPPRRGFWIEFSVALGFSGLSMMGLLFAMTARFRHMAAPYGIDVVYHFHRQISVVALLLILAHPVILFVAEPETRRLLNPITAPWRAQAAWAATLAFVLVALTSFWRKLLRIPYEPWRLMHGVLATAGIAFAMAHMIGVNHYVGTSFKRALWVALAVGWVGLLAYVRVVKPWMMLRRPYEVEGVREERGDSWTLTVRPNGHEGFGFEPGQFAWLTVWNSPFAIKEHPFSFSSSAADSGKFSFTVKEVGDFTGTVKEISPGERVYLDGPHGQFSVDRWGGPKNVFVAGGVGVTPIMSMLRTLADRGDRRPLLLVYASRTWEDVIFREEIEGLEERLNLRVVHVIEDPPDGWEGERGYVTAGVLDRHLPQGREEYEYFVCGPDPMMDAVEVALHEEMGVPLGKIHSERYNLV